MISLENVLKEILPIDSRYMIMHISELPADISSKIASYYLGDPKYMKLKHSKGLRKIQKKYKPYYTEEEREEYEYFEQMSDCSEVDMKGVVFKYKLMQGEYRKALFYDINRQYEKIKNIINKEIEEQFKQDYDIFNIYVAIRRKYQDDREYDVRHLHDSDRQEGWWVSCISDDNFDYPSLKRTIDRKQQVESDLYLYYDEDAVVSSYNISISLRFKSFE